MFYPSFMEGELIIPSSFLPLAILSGQSLSDHTFSPETSLFIPPGPEPLSSTRLSSFSSGVSGNPSERDSQAFWLSDMPDLESVWNKDDELPKPYSTCLSVVDNTNNPEVGLRNQHQAADSDSQNIPVLSGAENRRSVKGCIDYQQCVLDHPTLDLSQYPEFLDTKRMATVSQSQGIDVTCPDDVFIFSKDVDTMVDDFDKTVVGLKDDEFKSISISSGSSEYNSCCSDPYQSPSTENSASPPLTQPCAHKSDLTVGFSVDGNRQLKEELGSLVKQSSVYATGRDAGKLKVTNTDCITSPFVTGRTRSRLSHHSERMTAPFQTSSCQLLSRLRRNAQKHSLDEEILDDVDAELSALKLSVSSDGQRQADTLILSNSLLVSERIVESKLVTSEAERFTDMQAASGTPQIFPTDKESNVASQGSSPFQVDSALSLMYESPKAHKSPGRSGCTPRYSMSQLSGRSRPAAQPLTTDTDEPVEYLYTDTEEGHELIETHVPPTANTSFSSSTSTSEDTLLYDWRSLQLGSTSPDRSTESYRPKQESDVGVSGLTDKDLRSKLIELGENPGPINSQTRPLYIQKLKRSLQNTPHRHKSVAVSPSGMYAQT